MRNIYVQVSGNAVFELQLSGFHNFKANKCSENCPIKFRICLDVYQEIINPDSSCSFGEIVQYTKVTSDGKIYSNDLIMSPVQFLLSSWQVNNMYS